MCKKALGLFLMGTLFVLCSCVDDTYDLNKGVTTDVEIKGNKLSLPLGSLQAIMLDSLFSVDSLGILDKKDGVYSISMADSIAAYAYEMSEINLAIPTQKTNIIVDDFAKAEITEVSIEEQETKESHFIVPEVTLDDLEIPSINTDRSVCAANNQVKEILEEYEGEDGDIIETLEPIPFDQTFKLDDGEVDFDLNYNLPEEVASIYTIYLQKAEEEILSEEGASIGFEIIHPIALTNLDKTIDFEINFPEEFVISLDPSVEDIDLYTLSEDRHTISVNNLKVNAGETQNSVIRFYIHSLKDLENRIENGVLSLMETVTYTVDYYVNGFLKLKSGTKLEDFNFKVVTDLELDFSEVDGKTNDIDVDFDPITMDFNIQFDDLQYIDRIEHIYFDAQESWLHFHSEMKGGFAPFTLKEGYALKLKFPETLVINEELSIYPRTRLDGRKAIEYNHDEHSFYIYDLEVFNTLIKEEDSKGNPRYCHWALAIEEFEPHEPVIDGKFDHNVEAKVTVVNNGEPTEALVFAGTQIESMNRVLKTLDNKKVDFKIWESDFVVADAIVHTEKVISELKESIEFSFENNELPREIRRVEGIGFGEEAPVYLNIKVNGLEDLSTDIILDLQVNLPPALEIGIDNSKINNGDEVKIINETLFIKISIDPRASEPTIVELVCNGIDFTKGEGNEYGLTPKLVNNKGYIEYKSTMDITGDVIVEGSEFHAEMLDKEISVDVNFEIGDIEVKDFHGIFYVDDLGGIEESFALNLGDGLDFLNSEGNTIVLSDPQISISVDNSISIPISASLSLIGKDAAGQVIESSAINTNIKIEAAEYDQTTNQVTPRTTNLLITAKPTEKEGYTNLPVENLANLLKQIPASIDIMLNPVIDTTSTQHINLVQPLSFGGNYEVNIPLQFDEFNFVYSDTISGLNASLGEMMEMFSNVELGLNMNIKNSMPLQLQFNAIPLDEFGDSIPGLSISGFEIPAGSGQAFCDTISGKDVRFSISSNDANSLSALDKLKFDIQASANSTVGGVALRGDQGIKLDSISIEINGDIKLGK